jgi:hypothetical protein
MLVAHLTMCALVAVLGGEKMVAPPRLQNKEVTGVTAY